MSFAFGFVTAIAGEIPALDPSRRQALERDGFIYAGYPSGRVLARLVGRESRLIVRSNEISPLMKQAIVAVEDRRFYEHRGVDVRGILRAMWQDIRNKKVVEGGSTITQQFIKNTYIPNQRSIGRKLKEAALAWQLEQRWSKDRILTAYLNTIYFGNGAYGVEQAAQTYFHHSAKRLTLAESALLAGIPGDPSRYDPVASPTDAKERRDTVLKDMFDQGDISFADYSRATQTPLPRPHDVRPPGRQGPAPYFTNYIKQQLIQRFGPAKVFGGGLRVHTTINLDLQRIARQSIDKWLPSREGPEAALVAIDPRDGTVLAMIGGRSYLKSQFNLAVQGQRQPGSSFKPFVLTTALKEGVSPSTTFVSKEVAIPIGGRVWVVHNFEDEYLGTIDLRAATQYSDNAVYAQLTRLVGPDNVARTARSLGIRTPLKPYFSIGLGAQGVNPLEMARAFSAFANGGRRIDGSIFGNQPRSVVRIGGDDNRPIARQVIGENTASIVTSLLQRVIKGGTGHAAALPDGRPAAGKTGTTENYGDAWFVGYTPQLVAAVWVGYPNGLRPMLTEFHGDAVAGGTFPARIWKSFMERALPYLQAQPQGFPTPTIPYGTAKPVVYRDGRIQIDNGYCHNTRTVLYFGSQGPSKVADCKPNEVDVPSVVGESVREANARLAAQPLVPAYVYRPARPSERTGVVLRQFPARGTLSSYDKVTLVLAKPLHGVIPKLVGLSLDRATRKLDRLKLEPKLDGDASGNERVLWQSPRPGVAAAPGMVVRLAVKNG